MKRHKPKVLSYNVEKAVKDAGGKVLWTPPYCPDLHPIELYWSAGKGNVSHNYYFVRRVKSSVYDLRYGWYGNTHFTLSGKMDLSVPEDKYPDFIIEVKKVECFTLIKKSIRCANNGVAAILSI